MIEEVELHMISIAELNKLHIDKNYNFSQENSKILKRSKSTEEVKEKSLKTIPSVLNLFNTDDKDQNDRRNLFHTAIGIDIYSQNISENEKDIYSKILHYLDGVTAVHEIAWKEGLLEEEILKLVKKNPNIVLFYT